MTPEQVKELVLKRDAAINALQQEWAASEQKANADLNAAMQKVQADAQAAQVERARSFQERHDKTVGEFDAELQKLYDEQMADTVKGNNGKGGNSANTPAAARKS